MTDPIDIKDKCLSIALQHLDPGKPYHFKWLDHDLYLFLNEEGNEEEDMINIYLTEE
jgi:hypothetical protein